MASYVAAYRVGMLVSTAGALFLVSGFEGLGLGRHAAWSAGYAVMAALVLIGMATTLIATEPEKSKAVDFDLAAHQFDLLKMPRLWRALTFLPGMRLLSRTRFAVAALSAFHDILTREM